MEISSFLSRCRACEEIYKQYKLKANDIRVAEMLNAESFVLALKRTILK